MFIYMILGGTKPLKNKRLIVPIELEENNIVIAKRFVIAESIEEKMMKLKAAKRVMIEELMNAESIPEQFTIEDLQYLLT